jgi:Predicted carboxypeptidase
MPSRSSATIVAPAAAALLVLAATFAPPRPVQAAPADAPTAAAATAPVDPRVTSPKAFLGFTPGDDHKLANYKQSYAYFRKIAGQTKRMRLYEVGHSAFGEPILLAVISSEANLARLDRLKEIARTLAEGRVSEAEARALAKEGKPFVWIDGGMHATEVGCAQHTINLGYDMAAREDDEYRHLRENAVLLLIPSINPDGQNLVADWFTKHFGTPAEGTPLPVLYQKYSGHDNNRDWYMLNLPETRHITRLLYHEWYPQIVYNHHQSAPYPARIFVPPYAEPMNPNIPPMVMRGIHLVGAAMHSRFEAEGKSGVVSEKTFSTWWNGGMRTTPYFHNVIGILTETAHASPYPATYSVTEEQKEPTTWYPNPYPGGRWHFADTVAYMNTGSMAVLRLAADQGPEFLLNRWRMAREAIRKGETESPYGFVVPLDTATQRDPNTAALFLERMRQGGLEVHFAQKPITVGRRTYPAGTAVILAAQANRPHLIDMVTPQKHPVRAQYPGGPPIPPYDVAGWTLTLQMGVTTIPLTTKPSDTLRAALRLATAEIRAPEPGQVRPAPAGGAYLLPADRNASFTAVNRLLAQGVAVERWAETRSVDGVRWPAGTFVVPAAGDAAHRAVAAVAADLRLPVTVLAKSPADAAAVRLRPARVATYDPYGGHMPQGWTQLVLETFEFPHRTVTNPDIRAGELNAHIDTLLLTSYPNVRNRVIRPRAAGSDGLGPGFLGGPAPKEMPGEVRARMEGIGEAGEANLRRFVEQGGTLCAMNGAVGPVVELFKLPLRDVTTGTKFYSPGSIFKANVDPTHPLGWGLPAEINIFFDEGAAWDSTLSFPSASDGGAFALYPDENPLLSGWIVEDAVIRRKAAGAMFRVGKGRVVVYGFDVIFRGQPHMGFPLLFNALYPQERL